MYRIVLVALTSLLATPLAAQRIGPSLGVRPAESSLALVPAQGHLRLGAASPQPRFRTFKYVFAGVIIGGAVGAWIGYANATDCSEERAGCSGYQDLSDISGAVTGAAIGIPVGGIAGYVASRVTARPRVKRQ